MLALKKRPAVKWKEREEEKRKGTAPYNERHLKGAEGDCDWFRAANVRTLQRCGDVDGGEKLEEICV